MCQDAARSWTTTVFVTRPAAAELSRETVPSPVNGNGWQFHASSPSEYTSSGRPWSLPSRVQCPGSSAVAQLEAFHTLVFERPRLLQPSVPLGRAGCTRAVPTERTLGESVFVKQVLSA